ncbi:ATP-dependent RNA helicase HrpA [Neisseria subflava]|uniref:ATP-dependent RNA helicase HrpA n=1 Tax=Neisseria subflava TaxID=28449 RepID=UPI0010BF50A4|nr:ATP-dependent RNA helicase HrpA [Neisseria subflava]QCL71502.1 ATP-dependent RNA helicase HrpA [Neisseria subflava]WMS16985.1 ATP-dependent RNA helicase HrpA [Neisseria subflava]
MPQHDFAQTLSKDRHFLRSAFKKPNKYGGLAKVEEKYKKSHDLYLQRLSKLPKPEFDNTLPVHEKLDEIKKAIAENQVTIICGETGSGKTTQLPKICLELGRGAAGLIGHTQPRRLAARSVAERIAEELKSEIGSAVGYKVRFTDHTSRDACVKLMTDGILLAETQTDRYLAAYDTIIIDEAHERSLNIDFLLGYLKQLLPRRPDLKVIITSATIDAERFSQHFNGAPVLEVSGRTYPVEILYRPLTSKDEDDAEVELTDAIVDAADELARYGEGDILVFLPGEREIREAAEALRKSTLRRNDEILPLFARLSHAEQHKIFHPSGAKRRIVLATNVAETSLTVPGIKYVIDTGLARVKRYSARAKVEQLHVEKISQAAARQRSGRCGRVSAGVCIRLFSEEDFNSRTEFTDPEIVRSNLAAVILRMAALKLGDVAAFPFLEMPDSRYINDGFQVLLELGAVNEHNGLTKLGEQMARLPIDPKIARILLAAKKHDCMAEILVIASALSIQDPRERPLEARDAAAKAHERFTDKQSDFLAYLNIWDSFQRERDKGLSNKQLVQWCRQYFLSHLRMREWRELHHQLAQTAIEMGLTTKEAAFRRPPEVRQLTSSENAGDQDLSAKLKQKQLDKKQHRAQIRAAKEAGYEQIHRALLTGLIANVGMKSPDGNDYTGARGSRFHLFPASALFKAKPKWVMAAELVETTKLYARDVAAIQPEWIEQEAPHLVRYHYFEPHWEQKRGEVIASERVTLYGLTVLPRRPVSYGRIAPEEAREIFIRSALVAQECDLKAEFFVHNKKLIKEITELEHKSRKQDVLVDDEALFAFYHERLPDFYTADAVSDGLRPTNPQQPAPSPVGEGWGEGKTVAAQTNFSAAAANPLSNPLPQEREQSTEISTVSGSLHNVGYVAQATHADSKATDNRVRESSSHTLQNVSDDPKPKKQPVPPKGRLKPLPLADIRTFQAWLKTAERDNPRLLFLSRDDLMQHAAAHITEEQFPKHWQTADGKFKLSYRFEPHHPLDGVTLTLPLTVLNRISPATLEWLVPGMIREKIQLQIKALPKQIRRICVPVPEFITQFLSQNPDRNAPILPQLAQAIAKTAGDIRILEQINQDEWAAFRLPEHCYFNLRIIDDGGQELAMGRDLIQIQQQLGKAAATTFRDNTQEFERDNVTTWDIGTLPESIKFARGKQQLTGYLGLQKEKDGRIALRLFDMSAAAEQAHRLGVIELMKLQLKEQVKDLNKGIQGFTQAAMLLKHINADTLRDDLTQAVCDRAFIGEDELPRNEKAFKEQIKRARSRLPAVKEALSRYLQETAAAYAELNGKLGKHPLTHLMRQRLQTLLAAGFATRTPWAQWPRLPIYLKAMTLRLEKYSSNPARDAAREADIQELEQMWQEKTDSLIKQGLPILDGLAGFKWMIEELRVSLFAQELKTPYPVSVKRLLKEWESKQAG